MAICLLLMAAFVTGITVTLFSDPVLLFFKNLNAGSISSRVWNFSRLISYQSDLQDYPIPGL